MFEKAINFQSDQVEVIAMSPRFHADETARLMNEDFNKTGQVFILCLIYMILHTRSIFLAVVSLVNVVMCVPISLFIYSEVFKIDYFSSMHLSVIIIIVGIGSDDVFVFHDSW